MLTIFACDGGRAEQASAEMALPKTGWFDLVDPTPEEVAQVERETGLHVASRAELDEIESSSRLNVEEGILYLSMPLLSKADNGAPKTSPLGFVVTDKLFITVRFQKSRVFDGYADRVRKETALGKSAMHLFVGLLEALVDRLADVLEGARADLDAISNRIFSSDVISGRERREEITLRETLRNIGRIGDLTSRARDSLLGLGRIVPFAAQAATEWTPAELRPRFKTLRQDIASLADYDMHLSNKVQFLLDATLGFINIAQNNIMKVFTGVTIVGIPPVVIAGIYGMNFKVMPELEWLWGYPYALALMVVTSILPLLWFRRRGWL